MKKGNLAVMLVLPFVVAFLGVTTIVGTLQRMDKDITDIEWDYDGAVGFKIGMRSPLLARQVYDTNAGLAYGNNLVWTVRNADDDPTPHAELIEVSKGPVAPKDYFLIGRSEGDVILTVSNQKNTVSKSARAVIYDNFALMITPTIPESHANIDPTIYYGEYDLDGSTKKQAVISYPVTTIPERSDKSLTLVSCSSNLTYDLNDGLIRVGNVKNAVEKASFTVSCLIDGNKKERTVEFALVKGGINVYDYDQLLECTNKSEQGEIVVLRKNFESLSNSVLFNGNGSPVIEDGSVVMAKPQTTLFGHFTGMKGSSPSFSFASEAYKHETSAISTPERPDYIDQWNAFADSNPAYGNSKLSRDVYAGLRIQKDFYGNGYTLNMHNLAYPYAQTEVTVAGGKDFVPTLTADNLFRGPLLTYCLGDPVNFRIIALYGEDNAGLYLDGDHITVNDVNVKNCDPGAHLSDLDKVGSVIDVHGDDNAVKNSIISNGKNVVRCFSSQDLALSNCLLQNSYNFLLDVGTYEYVPIDGSREASLVPAKGGEGTPFVIDEYLSGTGDLVSNTYIGKEIGMLSNMVSMSSLGWNTIRNAVSAIGDALSQYDLVEAAGYGSSVDVNDVLFYNSGVACIGSETSFNGPFLYAQSPSLIQTIFGLLSNVQIDGTAIVPFIPSGLAFDSYPSDIRINGETEFFDYKVPSQISLNGLLYQEFNTVIGRLLTAMGDAASSYIPADLDLSSVDLDAVFPLKDIWAGIIEDHHLAYVPAGKEAGYVNMVSFAFGGGPNLTRIDKTNWGANSNKFREFEADLMDYFGTLSKENTERYWKLVWKMVESFVGYEPFRFGFMDGSGYNYGLAPSRDTLIAKASEVTP